MTPLTRFIARSLLVQMIGLCLIFVLLVLGAGVAVNVQVERQLRTQVQAADQALAQETASETEATVTGAEQALARLSAVPAVRGHDRAAMAAAFEAFRVGRNDTDHVYWIDTVGTLLLAVPHDGITPGREFEPPGVIERVLLAHAPVLEVGLAHDAGNLPGVIIADPVRDADGQLVGILAASLSLKELSTPLKTVVAAQALQGNNLLIRVLDDRGELVATPGNERMLDTMASELPGADDALHGRQTTRQGAGPDGREWLFSAVPVPQLGWAVVVARPADQALAAVNVFRAWLLLAALLFAIGVAFLWSVLLSRVIRPLHLLATIHAPPAAGLQRAVAVASAGAAPLAERGDEVGGLARALERLQRDVTAQLQELQTLLQTSNAVVASLDPQAVGAAIIREVGRLVDVQSATLLVPDESGVLRVLASDGRSQQYVVTHRVARDDPSSVAARALREGRPLQLLARDDAAADDTGPGAFPPNAFAEGFRAVLAIPILARRVGGAEAGVVLLVHRMRPSPFTPGEVDLLLTFANHAALAWEHAVLYERSDERLREVARENERLYRAATAEKQTLGAIMGSMSDGLVLTAVDGTVLYANPGASALAGLPMHALVGGQIGVLYAALRARAADPVACERALRGVIGTTASDEPALHVELDDDGRRRAIHLRQFDVREAPGRLIGRGLLLRDVTREREVDEMKTTLLAAVGHELRTPLAVIKGHASTLLADDVAWSPEEQQYSLRMISTEADRMTDLVRDLLDLSRVEAGLLPLHRSACAPDELVAGALRRLGEPARAVEVQIAPDLPAVAADRGRVEVVLRNLLENALAYGGERVDVRAFRALPDDGAVTFAVRDDGPGLAGGELPRIFERFYRSEHGTRRGGGTGLGLAISKAFVEAHGGRIGARDEGTGEGTGLCIEFTLPVAAEAPGERETPVSIPDAAAEGQPVPHAQEGGG